MKLPTLLILVLLAACTSTPDRPSNEIINTPNPAVKAKRKMDLSDPTNTLSGKTETLELQYIVWGCACANWVKPSDRQGSENIPLSKLTMFLEPATPEHALPLYFDPSRHFVRVTGQFYLKPDYPKGTPETEEHLDKAKVFRYTKMDVLKMNINYSAKDDTTLKLTYSSIGCTCAQLMNETSTSNTARDYYYLEPANNKLINADSLWHGQNLPLQVQVTGQIVSYVGYPTGFSPAKGQPEAGKVFRYTKIRVIKNGEND